MRLEKVVLDGFKSFADKTEFVFDCPVTAIVGPNGCGKSNVVDAVKWVLGEQSVKSLRSGHMADVIFGGSSSRKPLGTAEVTMVLSNTSGNLPIEADEVQISRRIYKSGESEYRINNKVCRLKDIRELFMDTGVAVRAYSVIEQGQVEQLLTSSKADRRVIFEEAAGISKYKAHKKEALRKLERTEQNLLRIADILGEVQKQLRSIKYQAGKARNYLQYRDRLKELQVNYSLAEYHKLFIDSEKKKAEFEQFEEDLARLAAEIAKADADAGELREQKTAIESKLNEAGNSLVGVQSKIDQLMQRTEFLQSRIDELLTRKEEASERIATLKQQEQTFRNDLERCKSEVTNGQNELEDKKASIRHLQETLEQINVRCRSLEADLADEKSGIIDIVRRTAQLHNEVQSICVHRNNLSSQKDRLSDRAEQARTEVEELLTEKAGYQMRLDDIEKVLEELQQNLEAKRKEREQFEQDIKTKSEQLANIKETKSALVSELAVLTDMEAKQEGLNNAVKTLLSEKPGCIETVVAEAIEADAQYVSAVEASLEGRTETIVAGSQAELLADKDTTGKLQGRVNFLCLDKIEPFVDKNDLSELPDIRGRLVEFVKYKARYAPLAWSLLGKVLVVNSVDSAIRLGCQAGNGYEFVTLEGEFLGKDGTIKLGPLGKATGLISRKSRLRELEQIIGSTTNEIDIFEEQIAGDAQQKDHITKLCQELRTAVYEANTEKMEVNSKLAVYEQDVKRLREEQPLIASEIDLLAEQIAESVQQEYESKQKLEDLEEVNSERASHIKELEAEFAGQKTQQQAKAEELTELKISFGQMTEHQQALKQTIESLESRIETGRTAIESAQREIQTCDEQAEKAQNDILDSKGRVSQLYKEKDGCEQNSGQLHKEIEDLRERQQATEQAAGQKRSEQHEIEQRINDLKVEMAQLDVKQQGLAERVRDELQLDLQQSYENYKDQNIDWDAVRKEIAELRGRIERLGNVNLDAIGEQDALEERNEFLSKQLEDLNQGKAQLQQLISRLNKISRERFIKTFEEIRVQFQQVFRKLFGGGKADIFLEDAEDILEAGIEIIAKPPGKETMTISLLSGGEKSLTAIALLFAVFKSKPSPFCFLDEVDAALDEANNERFNMLLKEFQKDSQFVVITHSKRTMSIADVLYGVTMQTRGVSKKISVRFDQYDQLHEEHEEAMAVA